jgi:hypothetical protein
MSKPMNWISRRSYRAVFVIVVTLASYTIGSREYRAHDWVYVKDIPPRLFPLVMRKGSTVELAWAGDIDRSEFRDAAMFRLIPEGAESIELSLLLHSRPAYAPARVRAVRHHNTEEVEVNGSWNDDAENTGMYVVSDDGVKFIRYRFSGNRELVVLMLVFGVGGFAVSLCALRVLSFIYRLRLPAH